MLIGESECCIYFGWEICLITDTLNKICLHFFYFFLILLFFQDFFKIWILENKERNVFYFNPLFFFATFKN